MGNLLGSLRFDVALIGRRKPKFQRSEVDVDCLLVHAFLTPLLHQICQVDAVRLVLQHSQHPGAGIVACTAGTFKLAGDALLNQVVNAELSESLDFLSSAFL